MSSIVNSPDVAIDISNEVQALVSNRIKYINENPVTNITIATGVIVEMMGHIFSLLMLVVWLLARIAFSLESKR